MNLTGKKVTLHDMSLRDGMHPKRHQISLEQMVSVASADGGSHQARTRGRRAAHRGHPR